MTTNDAPPTAAELAREPFGGDGIDTHVMAASLAGQPPASNVHPIGRDPRTDPRVAAWPPLSRGPLPPRERIPPDLNIATAQDEIDAWAHEHHLATNELETIRRERTNVQIEVMKARMKYRRIARANPTERGRRTTDDIKDEVEEALAKDPDYIRLGQLDTELEIQMGRLFRAKDNTHRLDSFIKSLPRDGNYRP